MNEQRNQGKKNNNKFLTFSVTRYDLDFVHLNGITMAVSLVIFEFYISKDEGPHIITEAVCLQMTSLKTTTVFHEDDAVMNFSSFENSKLSLWWR